MRHYVVIDGRGAVIRGVSCPAMLIAGMVGDGELFAEVDVPYRGGLAYVDGRRVVYPGSPPGESYRWDWLTREYRSDLELARIAARARVKSCRDAYEFGPFDWGGMLFDGDEVAMSRLQQALEGAREALSSGASGWQQPWKLASDGVAVLTAEQIVDLYRSRATRTRVAHETAGLLNVFIDDATTVEQVDSILWPL